MATQHRFRFLDDIGDGLGNSNMKVNGSITPVEFSCKVTEGFYEIHRILIHIEVAGTLKSDGWGADATPLPNGFKLLWRTIGGAVIEDLTSGLAVKKNADWSWTNFDIDPVSYGVGSTNEFLKARWSFDKAGGPIVLMPGQELVAVVQDDYTLVAQAIEDMRINAQGQFGFNRRAA